MRYRYIVGIIFFDDRRQHQRARFRFRMGATFLLCNMALSPGKPFEYSDLAGLGSIPASVNYDMTHFYDVSPMYNDASGNPWGHRVMTGVAIVGAGIGYHVGDVVSLGYGSAFEIGVVDSSGGVIGVRVISAGVGAFSDPASVSGASGGSGSGLMLSANFTQYGPTAGFSFGDFNLSAGAVTSLFIANGGIGYTAGDVVSPALILPGWAVTVSTVDVSGKIQTINVTPGVQPSTVPISIASFPVTGGTGHGAKLGGRFTQGQRPIWLSELNRLRGSLESTLAQHLVASDPNLSFSGPWPVGGPSMSYNDLNFYYADTGNVETVTLSGICGVSSFGKFSVTGAQIGYFGGAAGGAGSLSYSSPHAPGAAYITQQEASIIIGGNSPVHLTGDFYFCFAALKGFTVDVLANPYIGIINCSTPYNETDPSPLVSVDSSLWIGGNSFEIFFLPSNGYELGVIDCGYVYVVSHIDQVVAPGRYTVKVTGGIGGGDSTFFTGGSSGSFRPPYRTITISPKAVLGLSSMTDGLHGGPYRGILSSGIVTGLPAGPTISTTFSGRNSYPGIHNSKQIWQVPVSADYSAGFFNVRKMPVNNWNVAPFPAPVFGPETIIPAFSAGFSTSTPGLWTAKCPAISNLNLATCEQMPWNLIRTSGVGPNYASRANPMLLGDKAWSSPPHLDQLSNSYVQGTVEAQMEPPQWLASRYFSIGFTIQDSNGNFQKVSTAGVSGTIVPGASGSTSSWSTSVGGNTTDGGIIWQCAYKPKLSITPAQHRLTDIPRYPAFWLSETLPTMLPPTSTSGLTIFGANNQWQRNRYGGSTGSSYDAGWQQDNQAYGWWIFRVALNRMKTVVRTLPAVTPGGNIIGAGDGGVGAGDDGSSGIGAGGSAGAPSSSGGGEVAVTIGCIRNGGFVAFGTYTTGQTIQVLWPIFTSDALAYTCSERVDVQAVAIAGNVSTGAGVTKPICAAFINDTLKLQNLIN